MRRGLGIGGALVLLGCDDGLRELPVAAEGPVQSVEATTSAGGLTATLRLSPAVVAPGDTVRVRFAVANPGAQPVRLTLACTGVAQFVVARADGATPGGGITGSGCLTAVTTRTVPAGGETLAEWRFPASLPAFRPPRPMDPGRYHVVATPALLEVDGRRLELPRLGVEFTVR